MIRNILLTCDSVHRFTYLNSISTSISQHCDIFFVISIPSITKWWWNIFLFDYRSCTKCYKGDGQNKTSDNLWCDEILLLLTQYLGYSRPRSSSNNRVEMITDILTYAVQSLPEGPFSIMQVHSSTVLAVVVICTWTIIWYITSLSSKLFVSHF